MSLRRERKPSLRERAVIWAMTAGVVVLLGGLVSVFVFVPVVLFTSSGSRKTEAATERAEEAEAASAEGKKPICPPALPEAKKAEPKPSESKKAAAGPTEISVAPKESRREPPSTSSPAGGAPAGKSSSARASEEKSAIGPAAPGEIAGIDAEGFIRHWLVLAPLPSEKELSGLAELQKEQVKGESRLRPRAEEKVRAVGKERTWQKIATPDFYIDFKKYIDGRSGDDSVGYAACYIQAPAEMRGLRLLMGSNDQAKVYLNGAPIIQFDKTRTLQKDQSVATDVTLRKGENVLVFKVINEKNDWQGCIRFVDKKGVPLRNLQIALAPQP